jgi:hypothetical protein
MLPDSSAETTKLGSNFDQLIALIFDPACKAKMYHYYLALDDNSKSRGQFSEGTRRFFLLQCSDWLRGPPNLLHSAYGVSKVAGGMKLNIHLQLVPRLITCGAIPPPPHMPSWHDVKLCTGKT